MDDRDRAWHMVDALNVVGVFVVFCLAVKSCVPAPSLHLPRSEDEIRRMIREELAKERGR